MSELAQQTLGYYTGIFGLIGVIVGSILTIFGNIVKHWLEQRSEYIRNEPRRKLLKRMLKDDRFPERWRSLDTLMHVVGADTETTKRLLLEIGARASEDKQDLWGLIKYHPLGDEKD
jgi:hypothetical protein